MPECLPRHSGECRYEIMDNALMLPFDERRRFAEKALSGTVACSVRKSRFIASEHGTPFSVFLLWLGFAFLQLFPPFVRLGFLAPGVVEVYEPFQI